VVLKGTAFRKVQATEAEIRSMVHELIADHTIG